MAKDGTNRGGRRVRAGAKPDPLGEKLAAGRAATRLEDPLNEPFNFAGNDIGDGAVLAGETMPEPSDYLSEIQRDGKPLGADLVYRETWQWLDQRGCSQFVAPRLIEAYAQAFTRYVQCEQAISKFGLLGKHPTTGAAIASPFVDMSQSFGKQANVYWYEIYEIVRATCTTDYTGTTPGDEVMEQLLNARVAQDRSEYQRRFDKLTDEHATLLEKYHRLLDQISDLDNRQAAYHHYREELDKLDADHIEFTPSLWHTLVDHAEIGTDGTITFTFRDGRSQAISLNK